jgi:hypothetical protein
MNPARQQAARRHAKARASARLGVVLNSEALRSIVADIQAGRSTHLWAQSRDRQWHLVAVGDSKAVAVYGKGNKTVHTFLTLQQARETLAEHSVASALKLLEAA